MTTAFIAFLMAVLARASGGGLFATSLPDKLGFLPELAFGAVFGLVFHMEHGGLLLPLLAAVWSFLWMETGHGTAFHMGRRPSEALSGRKQTLSVVIDPLCRAVGAPLGGKFYGWAFMGLKGALIGLPVAPAGLLLAVLWPLAYFVGMYLLWEPEEDNGRGDVAELLSGAFAGLILGLAL